MTKALGTRDPDKIQAEIDLEAEKAAFFANGGTIEVVEIIARKESPNRVLDEKGRVQMVINQKKQQIGRAHV